MAWYNVLLIVLACVLGVFALLFVVFITNGDGKMIEKTYDMLSKATPHNSK